MITKLVATALMAVLSVSALAETYVGVGVGSTDYDLDHYDNPTGLTLYLGERISENLAIEAFYTDFGAAEDEIVDEVEVSANSFGAGVLMGAQPNEGVHLFVNVGIQAWDAEVKSDFLHLREERNGSDIYYGFGGAFDIAPGLALGARYTVYDLDEDDVSLATVNLEAKF